MKNKLRLILAGVLGALSLSACTGSIYDWFSPNESVISASEGGDYTALASKYVVRQLGDADGTPYLNSQGSQKVLVIPVTVKGYEANATSLNRTNIQKTFFGKASETGWQSVASFYNTSSFGKLSLTGTVTDWYACGLTADQITAKNKSADSAEGVVYVLDSAIAWYKKTYNTDGKEYDTDGDGYLDAVWLVYSAPDYSNLKTLGSTFWAFTYWTWEDPVVSSPVANTFAWASYDFMYEGYGLTKVDAHTFIHESGHILGLEDYYDTDSKTTPMGCIDMMDYNIIDHNVFSKFCYGWVNPYYINHTGVLSLKPSQSSGDCLLIPSSKGWNGSCFDEYLLVEYYTPTGLNESDSESKYRGEYPLGFTQNGIRIYHVDARMACGSTVQNLKYTDTIVSNSTTATVLAHSNTESSNLMDSSYRLIQEMDCTQKRDFASGEYVADNTSLFRKGSSFSLSAYQDSFPRGAEFNDGGSCAYKLSFSNLSSDGVVVSVTAA